MQEDKILIDSLCQGKLMNMAPPHITEILEDMALRGYDWGLTRSGRRGNDRGVRSVGASASLEAKLDKMREVMLEDKRHGKKPVFSCDWCSSTSHEMAECQAMKEATTLEEQVNFVENARVNNPYSNTYNPGWRNHPNFAWSSPTNPRPPGFQGPTGNFQPRPITCVGFDNVGHESKKGPKPKGSRLNAWRRRIKGALTRKKGGAEAMLANQEGQLKEHKMGGYKPRPESVVDPLSVASCLKS
ncbi:unnamed protein product [Linum trigynum]|uniref:Uncharacterized protein n=1 Tax=Linum trigynum TaxID=586398 RepID=A0AAV2F7K2_9ROSI